MPPAIHHTCRVLVALMALVWLLALGERVYSSSVRVDISVSVAPVQHLQTLSSPPGVQLSATDLARGLVRVSQPSVLEIRSNSPQGVVLELELVDPAFAGGVLRVQGRSVQFGPAGGFVHLPGPHRPAARLQVFWQLYPAPGASREPTPGRSACGRPQGTAESTLSDGDARFPSGSTRRKNFL